MANFFKGNFLIFTISMFFLFSTAYTIIFYVNEANAQSQLDGLAEVDETTNEAPAEQSILSALTSGFIDSLLSFLSLINPFGLIILLLKAVMPIDIYQFLDLILLRPIGWSGTIITSNYVISRIRGVEE